MIKRLLIVLILVFSQMTWAQQPAPNGKSEQSFGPRKQIATIIYCGLGGAVLGLSTLSFYGRPQDQMKNIYLGFGVGVIIGTIYMTYQAATNPSEFYSAEQQYNIIEYEEPVSTASLFIEQPEAPLGLTMTWQF